MKQTCFVCQNIDCQQRGSEELLKELTQQVAAQSIDAEVKPYICFGGCAFRPNLVIPTPKKWYAGVKKHDLPDTLNSPAGRPAVTPLDTLDGSPQEIRYPLLRTGGVLPD